jgi:hypothetical protein
VNEENNFSAFNYFNESVPLPLSNTGEAGIYGMDITLTRSFRNFYLVLSGSLYESFYTLQSRSEKGRFNTGYNLVLTTGKEFALKENKRFIAVNIRSVLRNGFFMNDYPFSGFDYNTRLPYYSRTDLRISYRREKAKVTFLWALDIQNLANQKNVSYYYYDIYTQKIETRYQLGLIPVLSFKLFF